VIQLEIEEVLQDEDDGLGLGQDTQVRRKTDLERVFPQDLVAERVERGDPHVAEPVGYKPVHAVFHLVGRLVRERQGQDLAGQGFFGDDETRDPSGQDAGLSRSRSGHDEERTLSVPDGAPLGRVEAGEDPRELGRGMIRPRRGPAFFRKEGAG